MEIPASRSEPNSRNQGFLAKVTGWDSANFQGED